MLDSRCAHIQVKRPVSFKMRPLMAVFSLLTLLTLLTAVSGCGGDDEGVSGKSRADANGLSADGSILGLDGGAISDGAAGDGGSNDGGSNDGGFNDSGVGDSASNDGGATKTDTTQTTDGGATDAGSPGKTPCTNNTVCKSAEFCALYYNGVSLLDGDGTPPKLPGWANLCEPDGANRAQEGEYCDPIAGDNDSSLKTCVNSAACMQGTCTALCEKDSQCPTGTRCGVSEFGKKLPKAGGGSGTAWLPIDICVPLPKGSGACVNDGQCTGTSVCRPWVRRLTTGGKSGFTSEGRCVEPEPGKQATGGACGVKSNAKGLGKLCQSSLCLYEYGGTQTGVCTSTCDSYTDCPKTLTWGGTAFPTACVGLLTNHAGTAAIEDDVYIPHCVAVNEKSPVTDCSKLRSCSGTAACKAYAIARGPETAAKVEYLCIELTTKTQPKGPTLDIGANCDPFALDMGCKGGYCLIDDNGQGYCSKLCTAGAGGGCTNGTICYTSFALIARKDGSKAATTSMCVKH